MKQCEIEYDGTTWKLNDFVPAAGDSEKILNFRGADGRGFNTWVAVDAVDDTTPFETLVGYLRQAMRE